MIYAYGSFLPSSTASDRASASIIKMSRHREWLVAIRHLTPSPKRTRLAASEAARVLVCCRSATCHLKELSASTRRSRPAERTRPSAQGFHLMQIHRWSADPRHDSESPLEHPRPKHIYIHMHFSKILTCWNPNQVAHLLTLAYMSPQPRSRSVTLSQPR